MKTHKKLVAITLALSVFTFTVQADPVYWTDWQSIDSASSASGQLEVNGNLIDIEYSGTSNHSFVQLGAGTNYWTGSAYTNGNVDNAPTPSEQIALATGGTVTINFGSAVEDVFIALNSWNNNTVEFSAPIVFDSFGAGYWGNGTPNLIGNDGFFGNGELHGVVQLIGSFTSISFTHTTENWHGFTVGIGGRAVTHTAEPALIVLFSLGLIHLIRRRISL